MHCSQLLTESAPMTTDRLEKLMALLEADPNDTFCTYGIAMEYAGQNQHEQALHWLDRTLSIDPNYAYAYYQKGRLLAMLDRREEAREALTRGLEAAEAGGDQKAHRELMELLETLA